MKNQPPPNSQALFDDYLAAFRRQFYPDDPKGFAQQKHFLIQAIAYPISFLDDLGAWLPETRIRQILNEVCKGIKQHGDTANIRYFGGYVLNCMQKHMQHNTERYYEEGKTARATSTKGIRPETIFKGLQVTEQTPSQFAGEVLAIAAALKSGPRRKKVAKPASQPTLF